MAIFSKYFFNTNLAKRGNFKPAAKRERSSHLIPLLRQWLLGCEIAVSN